MAPNKKPCSEEDEGVRCLLSMISGGGRVGIYVTRSGPQKRGAAAPRGHCAAGIALLLAPNSASAD